MINIIENIIDTMRDHSRSTPPKNSTKLTSSALFTSESRQVQDKPGYNERLFSKIGIRQFYHIARFRWLQAKLFHIAPVSLRVIEIGCFDGRSLDYLPTPVERYVGLDAGWEGGLEKAKARFSSNASLSFLQSDDSAPIRQLSGEAFNVAVSLETLEHIPPELVDGYLSAIAQVLNGYFLITVPNEKGLIFLVKFLMKIFFYGGNSDRYTFKEAFYATIGRLDQVKRREHKGFDYTLLIKQVEQYFIIESIHSVPLRFLPKQFALTLGIVARSRTIRHS
jgi:hypothetical protein